MKVLLLTLLALAVPAAAAPAAARTAPAPQDAKADLPDLKSVIDGSVRWMRSVQDEETGRYGPDLEATCWALRAFAESPRRYQRRDGPFVARAIDYVLAQQQEDGSIHAAGADAEAALRQTAMAAHVLTLYATPELKEPLARALEVLGGRDEVPEVFRPALADGEALDRDRLLLIAHTILDLRQEPGYWVGEGGREAEPDVTVTAGAIVALSEVRAALKALEPQSEPRADALPAFEPANLARLDAAVERGAAYLVGASQDGRFGAPGRPDAGLTAMAVGALQCVPEPRPADVQAAIDAGLAWLVSLQHEDGSIHDGKLANYITSAAILALARSGDPAHPPVVRRARDFLVRLQADEGEHFSPDHPYYGGIGYGGDERPDLSNLQMSLEALNASGLERDHAAYRRALTFLQRCQNRSESNDVAIVDGDSTYVSGDDGGSAYAPGNSPAGTIELGDGRKVARSYGSMTYALLKGYLFAGLDRDDPRVEAAWEWVRANYTLDVNPGFEASGDPTAAYQGLFYYFLTMARALDLYQTEVVVDAAGVEHRWREQLAGRLVAMQRKTDGSWVNRNSPRWWEGNPVLATSYALLTLDAARP